MRPTNLALRAHVQHRELELALLALLTDLLRPLALLRRRALRILGEDGLEARRLLQPLLLGAARRDPATRSASRPSSSSCAARRWRPRSAARFAPPPRGLEPRQHLRHHALAQIALAYPPAQSIDLAVHLLVQLAQPLAPRARASPAAADPRATCRAAGAREFAAAASRRGRNSRRRGTRVPQCKVSADAHRSSLASAPAVSARILAQIRRIVSRPDGSGSAGLRFLLPMVKSAQPSGCGAARRGARGLSE